MSASFRSKRNNRRASDSFKSQSKKYQKYAVKEVEKAVQLGAILIEGETKRKIGFLKRTQNRLIDTGRLVNSITHEVVRKTGKVIGLIGTNLFYAPYQEFGTSKMRPTPFLRPTFEKYKSNALDLIKESLNKAGKRVSK